MVIPSRRSLGLGLILIALLPLSNSAKFYSSQQLFMSESVARQATVVEQQSVSRTNSQEVQSVVQYMDDNGTRHLALTNVSSYPAPYAIGEQLSILVHQNEPQNIRVFSFAGLWFEVAFYLIPGLLAFSGGLVMLLRRRR